MEITAIQNKIFEIRNQKVMLDFDLANLYGVETKRLKESVKRNLKKFPKDFMFQLSQEEFKNLSRKLRPQVGEVQGTPRLPSQNREDPCFHRY